MTEYKVFHCPHGDDFEGGDECDRCEKYELCMETPNADVIERSKIDKAIEEIKQEIIEFSGTGEETIQAYCDGLKDALNGFKRNIGE